MNLRVGGWNDDPHAGQCCCNLLGSVDEDLPKPADFR
jgi:hypothetical protein